MASTRALQARSRDASRPRQCDSDDPFRMVRELFIGPMLRRPALQIAYELLTDETWSTFHRVTPGVQFAIGTSPVSHA